MSVLATQAPRPDVPRQAADRPAPIVAMIVVVLALFAVVVTGLWIGRRALRASGVSRDRRSRGAAEREEAFMAMTLAMHEAKRRGGATSAPPAPGVPADAPGDSPAFEGPVHCPACGATLGAPAALLRYVTKCPGCGRRVAARVDGGRVSVDVEA